MTHHNKSPREQWVKDIAVGIHLYRWIIVIMTSMHVYYGTIKIDVKFGIVPLLRRLLFRPVLALSDLGQISDTELIRCQILCPKCGQSGLVKVYVLDELEMWKKKMRRKKEGKIGKEEDNSWFAYLLQIHVWTEFLLLISAVKTYVLFC